MSYTLKQIRGYSAAVARIEVERIRIHAQATRLAQADKESFDRFLRSLSKE